MTAPATSFLDAVRALRNALAELGTPWLVIGGLAVIARGIPRFTADVDATISASAIPIEQMLQTLERHAITARIAGAAEFAQARQVVLLRHRPSGVPIDLSLAWLPFELEAIDHGERYDYAGVDIPLARVDDLVVYKLVAARARDLDDAERLILLHAQDLDVARLRRLVREFADALEDPERVKMLERLLRQAGL